MPSFMRRLLTTSALISFAIPAASALAAPASVQSDGSEKPVRQVKPAVAAASSSQPSMMGS
ncbi:hypothetical protein, partial [Acetobacter senegalensis]